MPESVAPPTLTTWHCTQCVVTWRAVGPKPCWLCGGDPVEGSYRDGTGRAYILTSREAYLTDRNYQLREGT